MSNKYAIIGGSQGYRTVASLSSHSAIEPINTPFGHSPPIHRLQVDGAEILYLSRHGETGYAVSAPYVNYRANIWALKELGVSKIIAWSGPGAIDPSIPIGEILVPGDIVDETRGRATTFYEDLGIGFIRQNPVFCPAMSKNIANTITNRFGRCRTEDIYVCTQGPRLETRAEIKKFAICGGTLVGMTLVPEAFLAKELEMCYCPICYVTNYAEGVVNREYRPGELFEGLLSDDEKSAVESAVESLRGIAVEALMAGGDGHCNCSRSMERYKLRGDIGEDWRTWVRRP
ncbi:MAG: MTAP family purine nucleoside phosphorylase [Armatimonadetes bacterium]|nr:MTAP family purine nucleoside phosphorylase [Armatimonadota bacterium]